MKLCWLEGVVHSCFNGFRLFREYKEPSVARLSTLIGNLMTHARDEFPINRHSNDETSAVDEYIPEYIRLVREFGEWKNRYHR